MTKVFTVCAGCPFAVLVLLVVPAPSAWADDPGRQGGSRIEFKQHDDKGRMQVLVNGKEALVYCYGDGVDLPHYFPIRSPSGQVLTVQQTDPYRHHRSVWFADTVRLAGQRQASFYNAFYSRVDRNDPKSPFRDRIRHVEFVPGKSAGSQAEMTIKLLWEMDLAEPVLHETRHIRIAALDDGEQIRAVGGGDSMSNRRPRARLFRQGAGRRRGERERLGVPQINHDAVRLIGIVELRGQRLP